MIGTHTSDRIMTHNLYVRKNSFFLYRKEETENIMVDSPRDLKTSEFEAIGTHTYIHNIHTYIGPHHHDTHIMYVVKTQNLKKDETESNG